MRIRDRSIRLMGAVATALALSLSPVSADDKLVPVMPEIPDEMVGQWCLDHEAPGVSLYEKRQNCRSLVVEKKRLVFKDRVCTVQSAERFWFDDEKKLGNDFRIKGVCSGSTGDRVGDFSLGHLKTDDRELLNLLTPPYLGPLKGLP